MSVTVLVCGKREGELVCSERGVCVCNERDSTVFCEHVEHMCAVSVTGRVHTLSRAVALGKLN